jgi:hypothetical protein
MTVDPQVKQGQGEGAAGSATGTTATAGQGAASRCQVQSFTMTVNAWNREWPNGSGDYVLQLPVSFDLELAAGTSRADCVIGQDKGGLVEYGRYRRMGAINLPMIDRVSSTDRVWTPDAPPGHAYWWDGTDWHAGLGSWAWRPFGFGGNEHATFQDQPGFASPSSLALLFGRPADGIGTHSFPIYWGGVGRNGQYSFRTYVKDAATGTIVRQLTWSMLIDYSSPSTGTHLP